MEGRGVIPPAPDLDVDHDPLLGSLARPRADERVGIPPAVFGVAGKLPAFLVERPGGVPPVDGGRDVGEQQPEELPEAAVEDLLPRGVVGVVPAVAVRLRFAGVFN